ncbi:RidA family protein [Chelativorans sp. YIM 93263]|uniref:RidA family protein n=1 Tax=Chelativorans sp. YIM 93263 TaxID=2906648 RepID=UPI002378D6A4|nr:Rid family hydrolase [Chelativorans sp. YIM 93263]
MSKRTSINPKTVFNSLQHGFSQGLLVEGNRRLLLSGQVGVDADEKTVKGGIGEQTKKALDNIELLLREANASMSDVVMLRIYIAEIARDDQEPIAEALLERFPQDPPPSSWIIVSALSEPEWLIEIEAEAIV